MIVCHCHAVSDREIRSAAKEAGRTYHAVAEKCGAGTACQGCMPAIQDLLRGVDRPREHRGSHDPKKS